MGRKRDNKIKKEIDPIKEKEKQEEYEEKMFAQEQDRIASIQKSTDNHFNVMWDTRRAMLDYCDKTAIPLCDYMTMDVFQDFVEYLEEHS